jgi:hypothetical protein
MTSFVHNLITIILQDFMLIVRTVIILVQLMLYFIHVIHNPMSKLLHDPPIFAQGGVLQIKNLPCLCHKNVRVTLVPE